MISVLLLVCLALSLWLFLDNRQASHIKIWSEGKLVQTLPLAVDTELTVETDSGRNLIAIKGGAVAVTQADCPDHYCMDRGFCTGGAQIVCLPNRLVIEFVGETAVDGVVG